jgi:hypothetical protein
VQRSLKRSLKRASRPLALALGGLSIAFPPGEIAFFAHAHTYQVHSHSTSPVEGDQTDHVQCLAAVGVARADRATCWIAMIRKTGPGERLSGHWGPWKLGWEAHARWASAGTYRLGERVDLPATPIRRPAPLRPLRMRTVSSASTSSCTL